jgi:hypothetical protein
VRLILNSKSVDDWRRFARVASARGAFARRARDERARALESGRCDAARASRRGVRVAV